MSEFKVGLYKHFKGNIYRVIGIATHTETGECLVLYKNANHSGYTWARPFDMFCGKVDGKPRFEFIEAEVTEMSMTLEQAIEHAEDTAKSAIGCECRDEHRQLAEWLKELAERRKVDNEIPFGNNAPFSELDSIINAYEIHGNHKKVVELLKELRERRKADSCEGCKNISLWENEYENGVSCPCLRCARRAEDNYEPERRTDE